jgi:hypothetical protein
MGEFLAGALRYLPFLIAGIDEGQVLLAVVVKPERPIVGNVFHRWTPLLLCLDAYPTLPGQADSRIIRS